MTRQMFLMTMVTAGLFAAIPAAAASDLPKTLEIGAAAPDFSLPGVDGRMHKLS